MGNAAGSVSQDDSVIDPVMGSPINMHTTASIAEVAHWQEKYSLLVRIFTTRDRWALKPHVWAEDLLKDFFQVDTENQLVSDSSEPHRVPHFLWQLHSETRHILG